MIEERQNLSGEISSKQEIKGTLNDTVRYGNVTKPYNGIANVKPATDKELEKYMI